MVVQSDTLIFRFKEMQTQLNNVTCLLRLIVQKMDITQEADDY